MGKITDLPTRKVLNALARVGWEVSGGSKHHKLIHRTKPGALTIPRHSRIKKGLLKKIIQAADLTEDEFWQIYK